MASKDVLAVVADCSGSMGETGKAMLARNLLSYVHECRSLHGRPWSLGQLHLLRWGSNTTELGVDSEEGICSFAVGGRAEVEPLVAFLEKLVQPNTNLRVLLISDGHFAGSKLDSFLAWRKQIQEVSVRALVIGPDAMRAPLKKMADRDGVFSAEDIASALAPWPLPPPSTIPLRIGEAAGEG